MAECWTINNQKLEKRSFDHEIAPLAQYVATAHVGVEIGGGVGLHYHYGTLGQLEHGVNYADAYLRNIGQLKSAGRPLKGWPYAKGSTVKLFVLAGHRNMEGEIAFVQQLAKLDGGTDLAKDNPTIAYRYSIGGVDRSLRQFRRWIKRRRVAA